MAHVGGHGHNYFRHLGIADGMSVARVCRRRCRYGADIVPQGTTTSCSIRFRGCSSASTDRPWPTASTEGRRCRRSSCPRTTATSTASWRRWLAGLGRRFFFYIGSRYRKKNRRPSPTPCVRGVPTAELRRARRACVHGFALPHCPLVSFDGPMDFDPRTGFRSCFHCNVNPQ